MHSALSRLFFLQFRAECRRALRTLRSPSRILPISILLAIVALWMGPSIWVALSRGPSRPTDWNGLAPHLLLGFGLLRLLKLGASADPVDSVVGGRKSRLLESAPFSRWQILAHQVGRSAVYTLLASLGTSLFVRGDVSLWWLAFLGTFCGMLFIQLVYLSIAAVLEHASRRIGILLRVTLCLTSASVFVPAVIVAHGVWGNGVGSLENVRESVVAALSAMDKTPCGKAMAAPFYVFALSTKAETIAAGILSLLSSLGLVAAAAGLLVALNKYLVTLARKREREFFRRETDLRETERLGRRRSVGLATRTLAPAWPRPWLFGAGPITWRQLTCVCHSAWVVAPLLVLFVAVAILLTMPGAEGGVGDALNVFATTGMLTFLFMPAIVPFDFRGDMVGIPVLKALPISPFGVVLGQLSVPVMTSVICQFIVAAAAGILSPAIATTVFLGLVFLVPANVLLFGTENLVFLINPNRRGGCNQTTLRTIIHLSVKFTMLVMGAVVALAFARVVVFLCAHAAEHGGPLAVLLPYGRLILLVGLWLSLATVAAGILPVLCWAYRRFDCE